MTPAHQNTIQPNKPQKYKNTCDFPGIHLPVVTTIMDLMSAFQVSKMICSGRWIRSFIHSFTHHISVECLLHASPCGGQRGHGSE